MLFRGIGSGLIARVGGVLAEFVIGDDGLP